LRPDLGKLTHQCIKGGGVQIHMDADQLARAGDLQRAADATPPVVDGRNLVGNRPSRGDRLEHFVAYLGTAVVCGFASKEGCPSNRMVSAFGCVAGGLEAA